MYRHEIVLVRVCIPGLRVSDIDCSRQTLCRTLFCFLDSTQHVTNMAAAVEQHQYEATAVHEYQQEAAEDGMEVRTEQGSWCAHDHLSRVESHHVIFGTPRISQLRRNPTVAYTTNRNCRRPQHIALSPSYTPLALRLPSRTRPWTFCRSMALLRRTFRS
jgi:hypothetical protein